MLLFLRPAQPTNPSTPAAPVRHAGPAHGLPFLHSGFHASTSGDDASRHQQQCAQPRSSLPALLASVKQGQGLGMYSRSLQQPASCSSFAASHAISTLAGRRAGLGLGLGLGSSGSIASKSSMPAQRAYGTDGQHLGQAFLLATDIMFWSGLIGAVVFRRNLIVMLLATEVVMLACNLNFLFGAAYLNDIAVRGGEWGASCGPASAALARHAPRARCMRCSTHRHGACTPPAWPQWQPHAHTHCLARRGHARMRMQAHARAHAHAHTRTHAYAPAQGIVMSITITTVAACETAIGLALCVTYFHLRSATDVETLNFLK